MNVALWTVAVLLSVVFTVAGLNKLLISRERLAKAPGGGWALDFPRAFVKLLGVLEILGAGGVLLPFVRVLAAICLAALMAGATVVVLRRRERLHALVDLTYLALALFVAVGRFVS